jgi:hypothetical protein
VTATIKPLQRRRVCEGCARPYIMLVGSGRFLCDPCQEAWWEALEQRWDRESRAAGFASSDARMEFEGRQADRSGSKKINGKDSDVF